MAEYETLALTALIYETVVFITYNYLLSMVRRRKKEKPTKLTNILFKLFLGYDVAILFAIIQKIFNVIWGGVPYTLIPTEALYFVGILQSGRIGLVGALVGTIYAYELYLRIFKKEIPEKKRKVIIGIGIAICIFLLTAYQFNTETGQEIFMYQIIGFGCMFLYMIIVYVPFTKEAFYLAGRISDDKQVYKKGIKSLGNMALSFVLIFFCFLLDQLVLMLFEWKYSVFYFSAWLFALYGTYASYSGYIKPSINPKQ